MYIYEGKICLTEKIIIFTEQFFKHKHRNLLLYHSIHVHVIDINNIFKQVTKCINH